MVSRLSTKTFEQPVLKSARWLYVRRKLQQADRDHGKFIELRAAPCAAPDM
jgi:hypothetical protein